MVADASGMKAAALRRYAGVAERGAVALERELRVNAPARTTRLRRSVRVRQVRSGMTSFQIVAETDDLVQAKTTNTGARRHVIRPRSAKTLRFYWPKVGRVVYPLSVRHPGNKGSRWWDRTMKRHSVILRDAMRG